MKTIKIDRSLTFNPETFIGKNWEIRRQNEKSLSIIEIDIDKIMLVTSSDQKKNHDGVEPECIEYSLKKEGYILLDVQILKTLLENNNLIPEKWKEKVNGEIQYIIFMGSILRHPFGWDKVLNLSYDEKKGGWEWNISRFNQFDDPQPLYKENATMAVLKEAV
jgi:hypothetical protein